MGDEDEDVYYECVVCEGARGRCRRSDGSSICKHNSCYVELRRRRAGGGDDVERTALPPPAKAARTSCFKIREVVGIDMRVAADDRAKRAGCKADNDNIAYKVRGGFGADKDDELIPTRAGSNFQSLSTIWTSGRWLLWTNGLANFRRLRRRRARTCERRRRKRNETSVMLCACMPP